MANNFPASGIACIDGIYTSTRQGGYPGGNDGSLFMCIPGNDYNAIRSYDSCAATNTIHFFGQTWANGTLGNSAGGVNVDGQCGVTLGPWNGPVMLVSRVQCTVGINTTAAATNHNGKGLVINGRGTDTRGIIELWDGGASGGKSVLQQVGGDTYLGQLAKGTGTGNLIFLTGGNGTSATVSMTVTCAGLVGIGTGSPESALHVCGPLAVSPTGVGVHMGVDAGGYAGIQLTGGTSQGAYIDFSCTGTDANGRIIYSNTANSMDFTVCGATRMRIVCNGRIGIGTLSPTYSLQVNGTFYSAGSSCEYKTQICNYNTDSCMFMKLKPVTYQYKDEYCHLGKELKSGTQIGLIAEDTAEVFPELAILKEEENEKVVRNVDYEKLTIILLSELQKLRQEVDQLKNK
jgi:hypothetical protein